MTLDRWLPADRQRRPKPAPPPTPSQAAKRLARAVWLCANAGDNEAALAMANRLVRAWLGCDCAKLLGK